MDPNVISQLISDQQFKPFWPYLKLARDTLTSNALISYWSLYYVLDQGIRTPKQDDSFRKSLGAIMGCLEKEKASKKADPESLIGNEEGSKKYILNYANELLVKAEEEAELGVNGSLAIKLYLACANVSQLLTLFGDSSEENAKRIKYSKWKAVTIAKEVKEGTFGVNTSSSAPDGGEDQFLGGSSGGYEPPPPSANNDYDFTSNFEPEESRQPPEPKPRGSIGSSAPAAPVEPELDFSNLNLADSDQKKAELLCESALYAIQGGDILSAVTSLKQTLQVLQKCARNNQSN